eukprot:m.148914 g.148914  ORF g.148914 m.148914 type:complete len:426 (+) comp30626_c0_seq5:370-1647(+)
MSYKRTDSSTSGAVPAVFTFLKKYNLLELESKFVWAPDVSALHVIDKNDISLEDVSRVLKSRFLAAIESDKTLDDEVFEGFTPRDSINVTELDRNTQYETDDAAFRESLKTGYTGPSTDTIAEIDGGDDEAQYMAPRIARADDASTHDYVNMRNEGGNDDDYVNEEAIRLFAQLNLGPGQSNAADEKMEDDLDDAYANAEAIELHTIDAHQPWMHGPLTREEAVGRLKLASKTGTFLVRMKGSSGRLFAFSILINGTKGHVKHNLIQFFPDGTVSIDNKKMSKPCAQLKQVIDVLCKLHEPKLTPRGSPTIGQTDYLLDTLINTQNRWLRLKCTRTQAEHLLAKEEPGVFYIREASKGGLCFSVRLMGNKMYNGAITQNNFGFQVGKSNLLAATLPELARAMIVDHSAMRKCGVQVKLKLSRGLG